MSLGELLNRKDSSKNNIGVASFWINTPEQEGLVLTTSEDGKAHRYFIDAEALSAENNVRLARQLFKEADKAKAAGDEAHYKASVEAAYRALNAGLTLRTDADNQQLNRSLPVGKTFN